MNELLNGIELGPMQHHGSHATYNSVILTKLDYLFNQFGGQSMSASTAEGLVRDLANQIKVWIVAHPTTPVYQIILQ